MKQNENKKGITSCDRALFGNAMGVRFRVAFGLSPAFGDRVLLTTCAWPSCD
ncbi:MAG: hypothetical protein F6J98_02710 [Moorea sp. SIO4G2]|nr:hypothetical protein [Moorena sp. SIO4G2]